MKLFDADRLWPLYQTRSADFRFQHLPGRPQVWVWYVAEMSVEVVGGAALQAAVASAETSGELPAGAPVHTWWRGFFFGFAGQAKFLCVAQVEARGIFFFVIPTVGACAMLFDNTCKRKVKGEGAAAVVTVAICHFPAQRSVPFAKRNLLDRKL